MDSTSPLQTYDSAKNVKAEKELVDDAKLQRENVNHPKYTQTASYDKESVVVESNEAGSSSAEATGPEPSWSKDSKMDPGKIASMQQIVENTLSQEGRLRVSQLLDGVESLSSAEKLLLYLRLPTGVPPHDPLKQPINPLGSRAELQQTVTWIQTHLEVDPDVSLPKQDVYDEYIAHCMSNNMKPLSTADFGKVMKQVYPTVRPRRLGTRGNSRYCYAGLRKKIKLEVPQLPDLGESSKESSVATRETERIVCDWAETKLGMKIGNISELSRHLISMSSATQLAPSGPVSTSPPPSHSHGPAEDAASRQLMKQLKRKIQTQGTPGRPKKNKALEPQNEPPASTSYLPPLGVKHEGHEYYPPYVPVYEAPYPPYAPPPSHPASHHYRDRYVLEPPYPRDLTLPPAHPSAPPDTLPINLSSDASLDLSTERADWQRRRPPEPPPAAPPPRLPPLPGKKLILETYQSERRPQPASPVTEYLPKKMRAAESLGGKLASRHAPPVALAAHDASSSASDAAFLEDPKNLTSRSKSTAAALAREEQEAASGARAAGTRGSPDSCCGLDGISARTGMICQERHSEILNRERVISICNIDKHALDHYLNEGNSRDHEEELLHYFQRRTPAPAPAPSPDPASAQLGPAPDTTDAFLERARDPQDDHSQGKNEKISQLRELLAKNLKNQSGSAPSSLPVANESQTTPDSSQQQQHKPGTGATEITNGTEIPIQIQGNDRNHNNCSNEIRNIPPYHNEKPDHLLTHVGGPHLYNGNGHTEPQSPTTRTQQYDFVPISDGCHSPGNFHSKSPLGFNQRGHSPTKVNKQVVMGGSLQTSPVSHTTAASPFVSPRNTPVPRSRMFSRPIPKLNGTGKKRRNPLSLGVADPCSKQFIPPSDQKFVPKTSLCGPIFRYNQPMSAPPSPNIISQYKNHVMFPCVTNMPNGTAPNITANFLTSHQFRETTNGDHGPPLSADPLSSEVSQFFQESLQNFRPGHDTSFRSQSVPLKHGINTVGLLSYNNTPVGSVPPTPVPNEFSDFDSLADTCDISKAGLNPETLDKIYDAIDSSNDVLNTSDTQSLLATSDTLANGCDPRQQILAQELNSLIPTAEELLDRNNQFSQTFTNDPTIGQNVEDFLQKVQRANSIEFDMTSINDKSKYNTSRSVPSTPLPYKRTVSNLNIDPRRSRELFTLESYPDLANGISSKSVPSTPQLTEERSMFSYSNRDFLINGNSVETCNTAQLHGTAVDNNQSLTSPLHDMLREDILEPLERLTPAADLLADFDKIDGSPYGDL